MQGTRMSFRSKEDAIHFAEKQGAYLGNLETCPGLTFCGPLGWDYYVYVFVDHLTRAHTHVFQPTTSYQANSTKELCRELLIPSRYTQDHEDKIDESGKWIPLVESSMPIYQTQYSLLHLPDFEIWIKR